MTDTGLDALAKASVALWEVMAELKKRDEWLHCQMNHEIMRKCSRLEVDLTRFNDAVDAYNKLVDEERRRENDQVSDFGVGS